MKNTYDQTYLESTLYTIDRSIEDLETWSVYNNDIALEKIQQLKKELEKIQKKLIKL